MRPLSARARLVLQRLEDRLTPADFSVAGPTNFASASSGDAVWGDYDGDGYLDVLVVGQTGATDATRKALVYKGNGTSSFTLAATLPIGIQNGTGAWGDFDNDGDLDIALVGDDSDGGVTTAIFRNDGSNTFTNINAGLVGTGSASLAWGDFNNDGRLDLIVAGIEDGSRATRLYRNDGGGNFTEVTGTGLIGVSSSAVAWGDFNGDGYLDLAIAGDSADGVTTRVYRNEGGSGLFTEVAELAGTREGSVAWGDFDNDGDLDLLTSGYTSGSTGAVTKLYQNDAGVFTAVTVTNLTGVGRGTAVWGDYNNDGILDITVIGSAGNNDSSKTVRFFRGVGDGTFTQTQSFIGLTSASAAWGDYDNDGKLDGLYTGKDGTSTTALLRNTTTTAANTAPDAPYGLVVTINSHTSVTLSWTAPFDSEQSTGLTYAIRVGTTPGGSDVVSAMAGESGFRNLPRIGFVQSANGWTLNGLSIDTTYYWSVQAIDSGLAGSAFSAEETFVTYTTPPPPPPPPSPPPAPPGPTRPEPESALMPTPTPTPTPPKPAPTPIRTTAPVLNAPEGAGVVRVLNPDGTTGATITPYIGYSGRVVTAQGDVNRDGFDDIVTGAAGHIKVFDGVTGAEIASFFAFDGYRGGVQVAAGDLNGDGRAELIVSADSNGHVKVFDGATGTLSHSFFAFDGYTGAAAVAVGDLDGDSTNELIVAAGTGAGVHVKVFGGPGLGLADSFLVAGPGGDQFALAVGDLDGDTAADFVIAQGTRVQVLDGQTRADRGEFDAFDDFAGVMGIQVDGGDILAAAETRARTHVKRFDGRSFALLDSYFPDDRVTA